MDTLAVLTYRAEQALPLTRTIEQWPPKLHMLFQHGFVFENNL